ncbi:transaldolase family protein [Bacillus licheniformis]|uniref:transaldolase family protein n=1 Tax=Bacillus licheniformis TaxID=1402 RepID=UPI00211C4EAE|nr:transaldolase family protein [Bacillus licheniformis]WIW98291.1 transaldolase family protein [Bacillus licheniformis]
MNMLIDSAHIPEIERLLDSFPAGGVTTNPALIARENKPFKTADSRYSAASSRASASPCPSDRRPLAGYGRSGEGTL